MLKQLSVTVFTALGHLAAFSACFQEARAAIVSDGVLLRKSFESYIKAGSTEVDSLVAAMPRIGSTSTATSDCTER